MSTEESHEEINSVISVDYLEKLVNEGYEIQGPRNDPSKDLTSFKIFLKKRREFVREDWLSDNGYQFVEPSTFTNGRRIAYKMIEGFPDERFKSNYSLRKGDQEIPLYLKVEFKVPQE